MEKDKDYILEQVKSELSNEVVVQLWNDYCNDEGDCSSFFEFFDDYGISNLYGDDNKFEMIREFILSAKDNSIDLYDEYLRLDNYGYPVSYSTEEAVKEIDVQALVDLVSEQNAEWLNGFNQRNRCDLKFFRDQEEEVE